MDYLWAPWRSTYMEAKRDKSRCIFCIAASSGTDEQTLVIYRGTANFVILNRYPYSTGHLMVAPFQHVSRLRQVDEATTDEMMRLARFAETALEDIYQPDGLNLGMNLGELAARASNSISICTCCPAGKATLTS